MTRKLIATALAIVATYLVAVVLVSQFNIAQVVEMGFAINTNQRFNAALHDVGGMLVVYLPVIAIALLIAFTFTSMVLERFFDKSAVLFTLAGFVALLTVHITLGIVFGVAGIAPTRTLYGLLSQGLAGAIGGYIYFRVSTVAKPANH